MANGYSVSALGGKKEVMQVGSINQDGMERTFLLSSTHGAEMPGLAAFLAAVNIYKTDAVIEHLWQYGKRLKVGAGTSCIFAWFNVAFCIGWTSHFDELFNSKC